MLGVFFFFSSTTIYPQVAVSESLQGKFNPLEVLSYKTEHTFLFYMLITNLSWAP